MPPSQRQFLNRRLSGLPCRSPDGSIGLHRCPRHCPGPPLLADPHLPAAAAPSRPRGQPPGQDHRSLRPFCGRGDLGHQHQSGAGGRRSGFCVSPVPERLRCQGVSGRRIPSQPAALRGLAGEGGITRPWDFRRARRSAVNPDGTTPGGRRYRCNEIGSYARAQGLLRQGHSYLDSNSDGEACESLR